MRSLGKLLKMRGVKGALAMSWPKRTWSLTSTAPFGFTEPEWLESRPAHLPGHFGAPHIFQHSFSLYSGSRQPLLSRPFQPLALAQDR